MRYVLISFFSLSLFSACGDGVDRWSGPGCQPACVVGDTDFERVQCLDGDHDQRACLEEGISNVVCENTGDVVTCDTDDGKPRCLGGAIERPICTR